MIIYPDKPWYDGQTFTHTSEAGKKITGTYDKPENTWRFSAGLNDETVYTNTVFTVDIKPSDVAINRAGQLFDESLPLPDIDTLTTQQDVNWYLYDLINTLGAGSQLWVGTGEPPQDGTGTPLYAFWWNPDEEQLYVWDTVALEWKLTGLMDFDRPPIVGNIEPLEHPKFPGKELAQGDLWYNTSRLELFIYWMGAWFPTSAPSVGFDGVSTETFTYTINRIFSLTDEIYLKNLEQDNRLDVLEENIGELEEEIDAIAPSNERGEWTFNPAGVASPGNYAFLNGSTQPTDRFDGAATIYVSTRDADNVTHSFNNHRAGEYLQIFNKEDDGYGLYQITDIDDNSTGNNPFFAFTVDFVRSLVTVPKAVNRGRFKFFTIAEGDPGAYVLKTGDEMEGNLKFKDNNQVQTRYINSGQDSNLSIQRKGETKILVGSDNVQLQKPIKFVSGSFATANEHAIHKGYVDEKYAELLAKIEELEMAGGGGTNYRFRMTTGGGSSSTIGAWMQPNQILTAARNPSSNWQNLDAHEISGGDGYLYVCFPDDTYTLHPTGTLHFNARSSLNHEFFDPNTQTLKLVISNLVKCPDAYNGGKNIWRADIQPDLYRTEYGMNFGGFFGSDDLYVTFAGGSLTKVTP